MEKFCGAILVPFFGNVITITSLKWRHTWLFKIWICNNQLEKTQFGQITQLQVPKSKIKWPWGRRSPSAGKFLKIYYKVMHFRHISAKI